MTGSAKQSMSPFAEAWTASSLSLPCANADALVAGNDGGEFSDSHVKQRHGHASAFSRRDAPEAWLDVHPPKRTRGRRESRVRAAPAVSCAKCVNKNAHEHTGSAEASGFPCAVGYGLLRALPGDRAFLPPSSLRSFLLKNLTPASGR